MNPGGFQSGLNPKVLDFTPCKDELLDDKVIASSSSSSNGPSLSLPIFRVAAVYPSCNAAAPDLPPAATSSLLICTAVQNIKPFCRVKAASIDVSSVIQTLPIRNHFVPSLLDFVSPHLTNTSATSKCT